MPVLSSAAGLISGSQLPQVDVLIKECIRQSRSNATGAPYYCDKIPDYVSEVSGGVVLYNINQLDSDQQEPYVRYLNGNYSKEVLTALHVEDSPKDPKFDRISSSVGDALASVNIDSSIPIFNELLHKRHFPMLWYIGQFDTQDGVAGHERLVRLLRWHRAKDFHAAPRWIYNTEKGELAGYFKQVANFTWMIFSRSGHLAPSDQPLNSLLMVKDYIAHQHAIPLRKGYNHSQIAMCSFMENCSGNGECDPFDGLCKCNKGYAGADCSIPREAMLSLSSIRNYLLAPHEWVYLEVKDESIYQIEATGIFSLYGLDGANEGLPGEYAYDFKSERGLLFRGVIEEEGSHVVLGVWNPSEEGIVLNPTGARSLLVEEGGREEASKGVYLGIVVGVAAGFFLAAMMLLAVHRKADETQAAGEKSLM